MSTPALQLWTGKTVHHRYSPFERRFSYDIALIDLDIERLDEADGQCALFGINRPSLYAFRTEDHGAKSRDVSLRTWADEMFHSAGISLEGGHIRLVTFPRYLFYKFAPISLWYGYDRHGVLAGIIYEVNNTFGETHCYVAATPTSRSEHEAEKSFHVSPFMDVSGQYRFTLRAPDEKLLLIVENWENSVRTHMANIAARLRPVSSKSLLRLALMQPFSSFGVVAGIHWQALKIWMRGAGYRPKPPAPSRAATVAQPVSKSSAERRGIA